MKVLGIVGSPRMKNTYNMTKTVLKKTGFYYEIILLKDKDIKPCNDCRNCHTTFKCKIKDDMQEIYKKLENADIIVLASPTYFHNVSELIKNFMDQCLPFYFSKKLQNKKALLLTAGGFEDTLEFDKYGKCLWHNQEKECIKRCLKSMEFFCECLDIEVIESVYALHDNWKETQTELEKIGKNLK
ncbi:MAG: flavodoxin family protein [Patescibacteria group bacterium]|nr:flavodoxin family protein [Patescibacteria group bacterium]